MARRTVVVILAAMMVFCANIAFAAPKKILVAYFSATGRTRAVAQQIASETGGTLFEIIPTQKYSAEDLDYMASVSRCVKEHNDRSIRPAIAQKAGSLKDYDAVFVGYPIWWGEAPNILATFLEGHDFTGVKIIPFATSHSSPLGGSDVKLHEFAPKAKWQPGVCFNISATGGDVTRWLKKQF